jgi:hypothetical protein
METAVSSETLITDYLITEPQHRQPQWDPEISFKLKVWKVMLNYSCEEYCVVGCVV